MTDDVAKLPWINESALAEQSHRIFHYTRQANLRSIIEKRGLYATSYDSTNDSQELRALRDPFIALVRDAALKLVISRRERGAFNLPMTDADALRLVNADAGMFHDSMVGALPVSPRITSFTSHDMPHHEENGRLALWRFYGGDGEGIALGFNTEKLASATVQILERSAVDFIYLDRVRYGETDPVLQKRVSEATGLADMFVEYLTATIEKREYDPKNRTTELMQFVVLSGCAKHLDFIDEGEVRLIVSESMAGHHRGRAQLVQPTESAVVIECLGALDVVMVGPSRDQCAVEEAVRHELTASGFRHVRVIKSKTPFRYLTSR